MATKKRPMKIRKPPPAQPVDVEAFVASGAALSTSEEPTGAPGAGSPDSDEVSSTTDKTPKTEKQTPRRAKKMPLPRGCQLRKDGTVVKRRTVYLDPELDHALTVFAAIGQEDVSETIARAVHTLIKRERPEVLATDGPMSGVGF